MLHGERDAANLTFAPQVIAGDQLAGLGPVVSKRGCSIVSWHGDLRRVDPSSRDRDVQLRFPEGMVQLTPGADDRLSAVADEASRGSNTAPK